MSWSPAFFAALSGATLAPGWVLRRVAVGDSPGDDLTIVSHLRLGRHVGLPVEGVRVAGSTLSPRAWTATIGVTSIVVVGASAELALARWPRGTWLELVMVAGGHEEVVITGAIRSLRGAPPALTIELADPLSAASTRLLRGTADPRAFVGVAASTTTLAHMGVGYSGYAVVDTGAFTLPARDLDGRGPLGALLVNSSRGNAFYRLWSGSPYSTQFDIFDPTASVMGTTDVGAGPGDRLDECAYLSGHPVDLALALLLSRGGASAERWDVWPAAWAVGLPQSLVDVADVLMERAAITPAGGLRAELVQRDYVDDVVSLIQSILAPWGIWLALRQGQLTVRAAHATRSATGASIAPSDRITDADIVDVVDYDAWAADHIPEHSGVRVVASSSTATSPTRFASSTPHGPTLEYTLPVWHAAATAASSVVGRLTEAATHVPERLTLRCAGLRLWSLTVGDVVEVRTRRCWSRRGSEWAHTAVVVSVDADVAAGTTTVAVVAYPAEGEP